MSEKTRAYGEAEKRLSAFNWTDSLLENYIGIVDYIDKLDKSNQMEILLTLRAYIDAKMSLKGYIPDDLE
jgi:hypothetical protein